jgi:hypothetical protein
VVLLQGKLHINITGRYFGTPDIVTKLSLSGCTVSRKPMGLTEAEIQIIVGCTEIPASIINVQFSLQEDHLCGLVV